MAAGSTALPRIDFNSDALDLKLKMEIPADAARIDDVVQGIMKMVGAMDCAQGHQQEIELALQEALANAILHGAGNDPHKTVECRVACEQQHGMLIIVSDPGEGFDPAKVANPLRAENLYSNHGRGIFLINRLMDQVEFKRGGAEIHMLKNLNPE